MLLKYRLSPELRKQIALDVIQLNVLEADTEQQIFDEIRYVNKASDDFNTIRESLAQDLPATILGFLKKRCSIDPEGYLLYRNKLCVSTNSQLGLLREIHDQPMVGHPGIAKTVEIVQQNYCWPGIKNTVEKYIDNCHICHRSKASRDKYKGLLKPNPIPVQNWTDIAMDFVIDLPESEGYNAILIVIDRLSKERHYIPCSTKENGTDIEATA